MEGINWFDVGCLVLVVLFGLRGITNGIVKEIFGILGLIGGLFAAMRYKSEAGEWIAAKIPALQNANSVLSGDTTQVVIGFIAVLFGVWIVCLIIGEIISKFFKWSGLGFVDKIGGFVFSVSKIFLIFAVIVTLASGLISKNEQAKKYFESSKTAPIFLKIGNWILDFKDDPKVKQGLDSIGSKAGEILSSGESNSTGEQNSTAPQSEMQSTESNGTITIDINSTERTKL
ncbi:CvpA family protein [uncultured Campylobacter sp.]|uniref:CvpA family protein n=1 Tax=uncultured Campylobacter sp. TaxID=218934 RepID=UPI002612D9FB|nr:CvpA family protein [uncultured Campylobacter sp.]